MVGVDDGGGDGGFKNCISSQVWQYVTLMRRIFLIDCPGVVYPSGDTPTDTVLKGVVRIHSRASHRIAIQFPVFNHLFGLLCHL